MSRVPKCAWVPIRDLARVFGCGVIVLLTFHADESYDEKTFCVGGWLHHVDQWKVIEGKLSERVAYENRRSAKKDIQPISRFHASDCSNRKNEFEKWPRGRAVQFYKKVVEIVCKAEPHGIAWSCAFDDIRANFPKYKPKIQQRVLYLLCMSRCLREVCTLASTEYPGEKIAVIHDWGFNGIAQIAYSSALRDNNAVGRLVAMTPMRWQDCVALQSADLMAYEGAKICFRARNNNPEIRKSFRRVLGSKVGLSVGYLNETLFEIAKKQFAKNKMEAVLESTYDANEKAGPAQ